MGQNKATRDCRFQFLFPCMSHEGNSFRGFPVFDPQPIWDALLSARRSKLGVMGVRDLFWLDNGSFLITGYEAGKDAAWCERILKV